MFAGRGGKKDKMSGIEAQKRANGPAHTDTDTEMGYRDKGKDMYIDEFLKPNPNP